MMPNPSESHTSQGGMVDVFIINSSGEEMFIMDFSKDEYLYFIFFIYSLGLFCQHIYREDFCAHLHV